METGVPCAGPACFLRPCSPSTLTPSARLAPSSMLWPFAPTTPCLCHLVLLLSVDDVAGQGEFALLYCNRNYVCCLITLTHVYNGLTLHALQPVWGALYIGSMTVL